MDLSLTTDQRTLLDGLAQFLGREYTFEGRRARLSEGPRSDLRTSFYREGAAMGLVGLGVDEERGGFGFTQVEGVLQHEVCGRSAVVEPFLAAQTAAHLIARLSPRDDTLKLLHEIVAGDVVVPLAHEELGGPPALGGLTTSATTGTAGRPTFLSGRKVNVLGGPEADSALVTARCEDGRFGLFRVARGAEGIDWRDRTLHDGRGVSEITLANAPVEHADDLSGGDDVADEARAAIDFMTISLCAEVVGAADRSIQLTREHLLTRRQFGEPLASFQVLRHRFADMHIEAEQCRSMVYVALAALTGGAADGDRRVHLMKVLIGTFSRRLAGTAVQLHGAIGVADEHEISHCYRRIVTNDMLMGSAAVHSRRAREGLRSRTPSA